MTSKITFAKKIFGEVFDSLFGQRRFWRHFRRLVMLETLAKTDVSREAPRELADALARAAHAKRQDLLTELGTSRYGLTQDQAEAARVLVGLNQVAQEKPLPWYGHLWLAFRNPFNMLLTVLAAISFITADLEAGTIISTMVILSTLLRFWQEVKAHKAMDALKAMVSNTATVLRPLEDREPPSVLGWTNGESYKQYARQVEEPLQLLAPGDIILLSAGDMIPADCRVLTAKDLFVSQAAMTGESMPVEKFPDAGDSGGNLLDLNNILFMGTNVVSGSASAVVVKTGNHTYFGALAARVTATDLAPTAFQQGINRVSWLLIRFMMVMVPLVLFLNGFTKGHWLQAVLFALSVAVGLTPEMLPMIVTATLAKGAVFLSKKKVIVKRLDAIQNFGAMDVLCTDKTGTLTRDKIVLSMHTDVWGEDSDNVLEMAYLNSYYQTGLKNLLDVAVLEHTEVLRELAPSQNYRKVDELPFDFERRRMSVVVRGKDEGNLLITKGALEEILSICTSVRHGEVVEPLTPDLLEKARQVASDFNEDGLRVVAVATRNMPLEREVYTLDDEKDMTLIGHIAFLDPPKESAAPALTALAEHGVSVKVLTGDNELVTRKVCREVGITVTDENMLSGSKVEEMDDAALAVAVEKARIFTKLTPTHKARIVRVLKEKGHVIGFMGDGINDAAALREADIGISVDSGVDIAKEAADIILLEKSLMVLEQGVREGRRTFFNMLKYIKMTTSSNFGNMFSVLIASAFLPFLPMLPLHILVQNLLYDMSQIAIPFDNVDNELLKKPQKWNARDIGRFMLFFGPISSLFDLLAFVVLWLGFGYNNVHVQSLFQTGWFVLGLITQTAIVHLIRTPKIPFVQSRPAWPLTVMTLAIMAAGIFLAQGPLSEHLDMAPLPGTFFVFLAVVVLAYAALTQALKGFYIRRFGWQ